MPSTRKVIRTGNSLAVTIPSQTISDLNVREGDVVRVKVSRPRATVTYTFSGHPRQLSLIDKR